MTTHTWAYRLDDVVPGPLMVADLNSHSTMCTYCLVYGSLVWIGTAIPPLELLRSKFRPSCIGMHGHGPWGNLFPDATALPCELNLILPACLAFRCTAQSHAHLQRRWDPSRQPGSARCVWYSEDRNGWLRMGIPSFRPLDPASRRSGPGWEVGSSSSRYGPRHLDTASSYSTRRAKRLDMYYCI